MSERKEAVSPRQQSKAWYDSIASQWSRQDSIMWLAAAHMSVVFGDGDGTSLRMDWDLMHRDLQAWEGRV